MVPRELGEREGGQGGGGRDSEAYRDKKYHTEREQTIFISQRERERTTNFYISERERERERTNNFYYQKPKSTL